MVAIDRAIGAADGRRLMRGAQYARWPGDGRVLCVTPDPPSWVVLNPRAEEILGLCSGRTSREVVDVATERWGDGRRGTRRAIQRTLDALRDAGFVDPRLETGKYAGRDAVVEPGRLAEVWLYTNRRCNLSCSHCFLGDWERGETPLSTDAVRDVLTQARALGVQRVYFTGGEPLLRADLTELVEHVTETLACELVILTNGTTLRGDVRDAIEAVASPRLTLQISIEASTADGHEAVRGPGSFAGAVEGIRAAVAMGLRTVVATTLTTANADTVHELPARLADWGVPVMHVHWVYPDGRAADDDRVGELDADTVTAAMRRLEERAGEHGVVVDNLASFRERVSGPRGCRTDLCHAALEVLSVDADGQVYACAPATGVGAFRLGTVVDDSLEVIWRSSPAARRIRGETLARSSLCATCDLRFLCGGGCLYRAHLAARPSDDGGPDDAGPDDALCGAYRELVLDRIWSLAPAGGDPDDPPSVLAAMSPALGHCEPQTRTVDFDAAPVATYRCGCYLAAETDELGNATPSTRACFSELAPEYDEWARTPLGHAYRKALGDGLSREFAAAAGARILEVGCGTGHYLVPLAEQAAAAVGVDASDGMLRVAHAKARDAGVDVRLEHAFAEQLPFPDGSFDVVYSVNALEFVDDPSAVVSEMLRVSAPGGRLALAVLNRSGSWGLAQRVRRPFAPPDSAYYQGRFFTRDELTALLHHDPRAEDVSVDGVVGFPPFEPGWMVDLWTRTPLGRLGSIFGDNVLVATARRARDS